MNLRDWAAATLAFLVLGAATADPARAQFGNLLSGGRTAAPQRAPANGSVRSAAHYQPNTYVEQAAPVDAFQEEYQNQPSGPASGYFEPQTTYADGQYVDAAPIDGGYYTEGYGGYDAAGCDTCGGYGGNCLCPPGWSLFAAGGSGGRFYVTADYLYVRASFSEAIAYLHHDSSQAPEFFDEFHELDFQYESSYRVGGGFSLSCCDEQLRFMFTRLNSFAEDFVEDEFAVGPFETSPGPGGTLEIYADVDAKSYDFEYAKTWRLGGQLNACGCGDPCGCGSGDACGDACGCGNACGCGAACCPEWAITWTGGFRFAEIDWQRWYFSENPNTNESRDALSTMNFQGGGPRFGLEGRRYFGPMGCGSIFLKGDISLLLGDVELLERRTVADQIDTTPDTVQLQTASYRNIIPVTEIEAGMSVELIRGVSLTTGYLFSAWHDLGFRDQFDFATFLETNYDDANILGFDGFFARLEACY